MSDISEDDAVSVALSTLDADNLLSDPPDSFHSDEPPPSAAQAAADLEHRNQRHLWPSVLPYECESLAEFDDRLDLCIRRIIDAVETADYDVGLFLWVRFLENLLNLNYPLRRSTRARLGRMMYHVCLERAIPTDLLRELVSLATRLLDSRQRLDIRHLVLPVAPLWDSIKHNLLTKERGLPPSDAVVQRLNLALVSRRFFNPDEKAVMETIDILARQINSTSISQVSLSHSLLVHLLPVSYGAPNLYLPLVLRLWDTFKSTHVDTQVMHLLADISKEVLRDPESMEAANLQRDVGRYADAIEGLPSRKTSYTKAPRTQNEDVEMGADDDAATQAPVDAEAKSSMWRDIGIYTDAQFRHVMAKALRLIGAPVGTNSDENLQLQAQSSLASVGEDGQLEEHVAQYKLPRSVWDSVARIIIYSIAPDGPAHSYDEHRSAWSPEIGAAASRTYLGGSRAIEHLATFILATETFFHPLNAGHWQWQLMKFVPQLASNLLQRVWYERSSKCKVLPRYRLTDEAVEAVVRVLKPVCLLSMFSKDRRSQVNARLAIRCLAALRPDLLVPDVLQRAISSLGTLETTARTKAILTTLVDLSPVILCRDVYPAGAKHLPSLLELCLPGIDPNDSSKTIATAVLFFTISIGIKVDDLLHPDYEHLRTKAEESSAELATLLKTEDDGTPSEAPPGPGASDDEKKAYRLAQDRWARDAASDLEPWALEFLRKILTVFESLPDDSATAAEVRWQDKAENQLVNVLCSAYGAMLQNMSPRVRQTSFKVLLEHLSSNASLKRDPYCKLIGHFAIADPPMVLEALLQRSIDAVESELASGAASIATTKTSREIEADTLINWHMSILLGATRCGGKHLLPYKDVLLGFFARLLPRARSEATYYLGASLLGRILSSLIQLYPADEHFLNPDLRDDPLAQATSSDKWGTPYKLKDVKIEWHTPSPPEIEFALELLEQVGGAALNGVQELLKNPLFVTASRAGTPRSLTPRSGTPIASRPGPPLSASLLGHKGSQTLTPTGASTPTQTPSLALSWSSDLCRFLSYLGCLSVSMAGFLQLGQEAEGKAVNLYAYADQEFTQSPPPFKSGFILCDPKDPRYQRALQYKHRFRDTLLSITGFVRSHQEQMQVDSILFILHTVASYLNGYSTDWFLDRELLSRSKMVRDYSRVYPYNKAYPRAYWVARADLYHATRQRSNTYAHKRTPADDTLIEFVVDQALAGYDAVRSIALDVFDGAYSRFPDVVVLIMPRLFDVLRNPPSDEALKGALLMLGSSEFPVKARLDTRFTLDYITLHFEAQRQSDPEIQEAARVNIDEFANNFPEVSTIRSSIPLSRQLTEAIRVAEKGLSPTYRQPDKELRQRVKDKRVLRDKMTDALYPQMFEAVLGFAKAPEIHWFYTLTADQLLYRFVRRDLPLDPHVAEYFASRIPTAEGESLSISALAGLNKVLYYIKVRTMAQTPLDIVVAKTHNPNKHFVPIDTPATQEDKNRFFEQFSEPLTAQSQLAYHTRERWLLWPKTNVYYTVPPTGTSYPFEWHESTRAALAAIEKVVKDPTWWSRLSDLWSQEKSSDYSFDSIMLIKSLFSVFGLSLLEPVKPVFESLLKARDDADKQQAAAEIFAGVLRGSKHWSIEARQRLYEWLEPLFPLFLTNTALDSRVHWNVAIEYALGNNDPRRNAPLIQFIVKRGLDVYAQKNDGGADEASTTATVEALGNLAEVLSSEGSMLRPIHLKIAEMSLDNFARDAANVRHFFAGNLYRAMKNFSYPAYSTLADLLADANKQRGSLDWRPEDARKYLGAIHNQLQELRPARIPTSQGTSAYDHLAMTTLQWLFDHMISLVDRGMPDAAIDFLPDLVEMSEIHDNDMVLTAANASMALINTAHHPPDRAAYLVKVILGVIQTAHESWRLRLHALGSLQVVYYLNLYYLSPDTVELILDQVLAALSDPQPEVADIAATTLSGIVRCSQGKLLDRLRTRFVAEVAANATLPARSDPGFSSQLARLQSALLGACALVAAFPYEIPPWMPELLVETIAPHTDDPNPVAKTMRKCAAEFRRTHQDTWEEDMKMFTNEQLPEILDFTHGRADYFA